MSSGILGMIGNGLTGLNAAQAGMLTTQQNISNANTVGYHRQDTVFATQTPSYNSTGWIGNGVAVATVQRAYSQFLDNQVQTNQSQLSYYQTYSTQASSVDSLLGGTSNGLSTQIDAFFSAANDVANGPTSTAARQTLLADGQTLGSQISNTYASLQQQLAAGNQAVTSLTSQINTYAQQIATLNQNITAMQSLNGQPPNDLIDQRDQAIASLSSLVNVSTQPRGNGQVDVYIGNGQQLVMGNQANQLTTAPDPNDTSNTSPTSLLPQLNVNGASITLDSGQISGGQLGGWLAARENVVKPAMADLNRIAVSLGAAVNQVQNAGAYYDAASGSMKAGSNFFSAVVTPGNGVTDHIGVNLTSNPLQNYNYSVSYDGANYTLTRSPPGGPGIPAVAAGSEVTDGNGNGLGFSISAGTPPPQAGDTWTLNFQDYAASMSTQLSDGGQIAAAGLTTGAATSNTGSGAITASQLSSATGLPLPATVTLTYDSGLGQFSVAGAVPPVGNLAYTGPGPQNLSFNGVSLTLNGTPANGDAFTVNNPGQGDNGNMLALAALRNTKLLDNGQTTLDGAASNMVGKVASKASGADLNSQTYSTMTTQATQAQQSFSGVNLDEEAANLIRYQQYYQAAAKVLAVANTLFNSILAISP